ncbi:AzlC family ABC transporter permease [Desulfobotulus sp. H1]|uniref:AzlC family ABC transporter permease n=1 Tax=Desulfobotulus pelophilus TaxID=2823377 RepID=A0ABT3N600_9BACT|nr:AzlC family ABC transporter permease [Desulfobotulus pelophilus]
MQRTGRISDNCYAGARAIWPICVGYFPLGLAFGVLAEKAGLSGVHIFFMSSLVFAGSGQFIAVSMIDAGASAIAVIMTTFMVNLRHLLMSSSLAVWYRGVSRGRLSWLACFIVDETFAVNTSRLKSGAWPVGAAITASFLAYAAWVGSTVLGGVFGRFIAPSAFGIDYAMIAMFICLLVFQLNGLLYVVAGLVAALAGTLAALWIPGNVFIVVGAVAGASVGLVLKRMALLSGSRARRKS